MERRHFLASAVTTGAGLLIFPKGPLRGQTSPNNQLNIALIGAHGRASQHYGALKSENIVAICDVHGQNLALAAETFPKAEQFVDWRKCLERKGLDAVVICTPDHTHAHISAWALNRDLHVYCEKPLGNCVWEARVCRAKYLEKKAKLATQVGTQRHAMENFNRVRELIIDGAIGDLQEVSAWGNRQIRRPGYLPAEGEVPDWLAYDLWIGPSPMHPYNPGYFAGKPGANCLNWNMFWDFGSGQVGDMGSHTMDLAYNALDADLPTSAEGEGEKFNPEVTPVELHTTFEVPKNAWRGPITIEWYQGGMMPASPTNWVDLNKIGHGAMFKGTKGVLICDFGSRLLIPHGNGADMTYYRPRKQEELLPPLGGFQQEWFNACKGSLKTSCDFDYSGRAIEMMHLGLVAYRVGGKIEYDGAAGKVKNNAEADALLRREYREGWPLDA